MNPKFILTNPELDKETAIRLILNYKGFRFKYSLNKKIHPDNWDSEKQRAIIPRGVRKEIQDTHRDINTLLDRVLVALPEIESELFRLEKPLNSSTLREELDLKLCYTKKNRTQFVKDYITVFIEQIKNGERVTERGNKYSKGTITSYNSTLKHIRDYENSTITRLRFEALTKDVYSKYKAYLTKNNFEPNTIGKDAKNIKAICRNAEAEGIKVNSQVYSNFKTIKEDTDAVYLNETELEKIIELDLSARPGLDNARDLFLIMCYTGLRFSDLQKLKIEHFSEDMKYILLHQKKTGGKLKIPVHWIVNDIINKRNGLPHIISNVKLNVYIKDICELAKINNPVEVQNVKDGLRVTKHELKYKLVTVHTARRSFATNMYKSKQLTVQEIMLFTGHKTEASFFRYIKVTKEEMAERLSNLDIFKRPLRVAKDAI